ncbi:MAG TPA: amidohydrolase family protein [Spirochaetota bacterium]|nr:amidohydrolase family protein [Spirochaetota bacterium]HQJ71655.1 amidohydrolase family protein [Spirochaetota bacterium]HRS78193.1 amidohydrolase family protein [Spirochaetota bacterium]HRT76181.1 amidohydrolase family protein [Spirochaetota bacterium]
MGKNPSILRNVNLVDMSGKGERIKKNKSVVIENGRIKSILDAGGHHDRDQDDRLLVNCGGGYLLPGLIDIHVHCTNPFINPREAVKLSRVAAVMGQVRENLRSCIRGGVTTVRDMGSPPGIAQLMGLIDSGLMTGPRIVPSFSMITCPGGYPDMVPPFRGIQRLLLGGQFAERITGDEQAEQTVHRLADRGAAWIKTVYQEESYLFGHPRLAVLPDSAYGTIARAARARNKKLALHSLSLKGIRKGIELKVDTLEHLPLEELTAEDVRMIKDAGITVIPTLIAPGMYREDLMPVLRNIITATDNYLVHQARKETLDIIGRVIAGKESSTMIDCHFLRKKYGTMVKNLTRLREAGVRISFGTDAGGTDTCLFGLPWLEMRLMSEAGMGNYQILETATRINAAVLGLGHELGTIETGRIADLVLVEGDPVKDLRNLSRVKKVWKSGELVHGS